MKFGKQSGTSAVLISLMALVFSNTGFAVDPDMQGLVIDNGTGMCLDKFGELGELKDCEKELDKLWQRLDRVDRNLMRLDNIKPAKKSTDRKIANLCNHTSDILVDLVFDAANFANCCGADQAFEEQFSFLIDEFTDACE